RRRGGSPDPGLHHCTRCSAGRSGGPDPALSEAVHMISTVMETMMVGDHPPHPDRSRHMRQPQPRGPLGEDLLAVLREEPGTPGAEARAGALPAAARAAVSRADGVLADDDVQLSLFVLHALHYQGVDGVDDRWESDP